MLNMFAMRHLSLRPPPLSLFSLSLLSGTGLATILTILPLNMWAMRELEKVQTRNMTLKDSRVRAVCV
jgi:hypothetical protein